MFSLFINSSHLRASIDVLARAARNPPPPAPANVTPKIKYQIKKLNKKILGSDLP
jgi:hypothetical protein